MEQITLGEEIRMVLNKHCRENASNTPDYILGQYLESCLVAAETMIQQRETWYGRDPRPTSTIIEIV